MYQIISTINSILRQRKMQLAAGVLAVTAVVTIPNSSNTAVPSVWTRSSLDVVYKTDQAQPLQPARIKAARNEHEAFQIAIRSESPVKSVRLKMHNLTSKSGAIPAENISAYVVHYIHLPDFNVDYPDPLVPYQKAFDVSAQKTQSLWIDVYIPKDIPAGDYKGYIAISSAGRWKADVPINVHVYGFTLPDQWQCSTSFALRDGEIFKQHRQTHHSPEHIETVEKYYVLMLEHGVSAYNLPFGVDIFSEKGRRYLADKRMTSFITPYTEDREKMSDIINRYISLGMLDKAYYYTYDEAASLESYEKIKSICSYLHGINPDVRTMATISDYTQKSSEADWAAGKDYAAGDYAAHYARGYYWMPYVFRCKRTHTSSAGADEPWKGSSWSDYWDRVNPFDYLSGYVDIYCVSTSVWDMFESKAAERRSAGDTIWTYSWYGVAKMDSHPSKLMPLMGIRYQPWLNYHYDNKGLLAWCVDWWQNCPNPWSNIKNTPSRYAEGILLYPGYQMGINGGVSSIRFEALRDGLEDYQYLWMLEQRSDRKTTQDYVDQLVTNYTTYVQDQSLLASVRDEIAGAVTTNSTASR